MSKSFRDFINESSAKKCPVGKYWCYTDKKCKKIPHGYHIGRRGYLEQDDDEEKKNGSNNGNGNSNGNGGNGSSGNGNGNGGNGGGGMGESFVTIENSDGKEFAQVVDIVGPTHMHNIIHNGVWKGTKQVR